MPLLTRAASRLVEDVEHPLHAEWIAFCVTQTPISMMPSPFRRSRHTFGGIPWWQWPREIRQRDTAALEELCTTLASEIACGKAIAFLFERQWAAIRAEAESRGIHVFGDLPIYVSHDSADVWANQSFFAVDEDGAAEWVAGVPPDLFSETGQLWGNPLYDWSKLKADGYRWWIDRIERALEWTPMIRLDHFRGFSAYYAIEGTADTAMGGTWIDGPGCQLFNALDRALGVQSYIAEDLGEIDDAVHELRRDSGMICMRILQFGLTDAHSISPSSRLSVGCGRLYWNA